MSTPSDPFAPASPGSAGTPGTPVAPSTGEFTTAWIAYGCYFVGLLMWWPMLVGLVISYVRRGETAAGFIDSHYGWLIRSFWWSTLGYVAMVALVIAGAWPLVRDIIAQAEHGGRVGDWGDGGSISFAWDALFTTVGAATVGGIGLFAVWCWLVYRVIRGALRLGSAQPVH